MRRGTLLVIMAVAVPVQALAEPAKAVKVTVLSTMLAGNPGGGIGEWGFAALLEVDGRRLLVDTGARQETLLRNASELGIDLSDGGRAGRDQRLWSRRDGQYARLRTDESPFSADPGGSRRLPPAGGY